MQRVIIPLGLAVLYRYYSLTQTLIFFKLCFITLVDVGFINLLLFFKIFSLISEITFVLYELQDEHITMKFLICFLCQKKNLLTYLPNYFITYLLTYLLNYLLTYFTYFFTFFFTFFLLFVQLIVRMMHRYQLVTAQFKANLKRFYYFSA